MQEKRIKVKATFVEEMLGTLSANPKLFEEFIGSKSKDADKLREELEALPSDELIEKSMTVLYRDESGNPYLFDYQIKGFLKAMFGIFVEFESIQINKMRLSKWTYKRIVDNFIFVYPRMIPLQLPSDGKIGECTRPLRADTQRGPRIALAHSESVPSGTHSNLKLNSWNPHWSH